MGLGVEGFMQDVAQTLRTITRTKEIQSTVGCITNDTQRDAWRLRRLL